MHITNIKKVYESDIFEKDEKEVLQYIQEAINFLNIERNKLKYIESNKVLISLFFNIDSLSNGEKAQLRRAYELCIRNRNLEVINSIFWKVCPIEIHGKSKKILYFISMVYAYLGCKQSEINFERVSKKVLTSDSSQLKFERMLNSSDLDEFLVNSYTILKLIRANTLSFEFLKFFNDVNLLFVEKNNIGQKIKMKWAENFYIDNQ